MLISSAYAQAAGGAMGDAGLMGFLPLVLMFVLLRFGLVAIMAAACFINSIDAITLGGDWKTWYAPAGLATVTMLLGIAVFGFWRSLGQRELIGGKVAEA